MRSFKDLIVWRKAHGQTLDLYRVSRTFPREEQYGLTSQIRRSAASICANIAEGCGRGTPRDFARFVQIALGSASELEYHLILATDLELITEQAVTTLQKSLVDVKRMLTGLVRRLIVDSRKS